MKYHCEKCNYSTVYKQNFQKHLVSQKHIGQRMCDIIPNLDRKYTCIFYCECCKIYLAYKSHAKAHLKTKKHKKNKTEGKGIIRNINYSTNA